MAETSQELRDALDEITRLRAEVARLKQAEAERDALRTHLAEWQQAAKAIQRDKDSEQDRRVAAQEAITFRWEPQVAALRATLAAVREKLQALAKVPELCDPECEGRCRLCPVDAVREALALLDGTAEGGEK